MPKINVYLPDDLAAAVRDAQVPVSAVCQQALEGAVREITSLRATDQAPGDHVPAVGALERFTPRARRSLTLAEGIARDVPHNDLGTEHLLLGILDEGSNLAIKVLDTLDVEVEDLRSETRASMGPPSTSSGERVPFTPLATQVLEATSNEARTLAHNYIGCEHLLLGLIAVEDGVASKVLRRMGLERLTTRRAVVAALSGYVHARQGDAPSPSRAADADSLQQILRRLEAIERRLET
jgi:ATP-dependent Clp protease ATP-binding subunit ClpA